MKVFVPFSEYLVEETGLGIGTLVPFKLEYECLRLGGWEAVELITAPKSTEAELHDS